MKNLLALLAALSLAGCASISPPREVAQLTPTLSYQDTIELLAHMTNKCWASEVNPLKDAVVLSHWEDPQSQRYVVAGFRLNWGVGLAKTPFVVVSVTQSDGRPRVAVSEGDFSFSLFRGPYRLEAASHVTAWLAGDHTCKDFAVTLWHA